MLVVALGGLLTLPDPGSAQYRTISSTRVQEGAERGAIRFPTYVRAFYERQSVDGGSWQSYGAAAGLRLGPTSGEILAWRATRFGLHDTSIGADLYTTLWTRAYLYTGIHIVPDAEVLPSRDLRAALFQVFARTWEASFGGRLLDYPAAELEVLTAGLGHYVERWYIRANGSYIMDADGVGGAVLIRRYLESPAAAAVPAQIEAVFGGGDAVVELRSTTTGVVVDVRESAFGTLGVRVFPGHGATGISAGVGAFKYDGLATRWSVSLGLLYRY